MTRLEELKELEKNILEHRESVNGVKKALSKKLYSVRTMIRVEERKIEEDIKKRYK